jgi:hypothetical protein
VRRANRRSLDAWLEDSLSDSVTGGEESLISNLTFPDVADVHIDLGGPDGHDREEPVWLLPVVGGGPDDADVWDGSGLILKRLEDGSFERLGYFVYGRRAQSRASLIG